VAELLSIVRRCAPLKNIHIGLEGYSYQSRGDAITKMAEVKQAVLDSIYAVLGFDHVAIIAPMTWKSCLVDRGGKLDKEGVIKELIAQRLEMQRLYDAIGKRSHNFFDAYAMALLMEQTVSGRGHTDSASRFALKYQQHQQLCREMKYG